MIEKHPHFFSFSFHYINSMMIEKHPHFFSFSFHYINSMMIEKTSTIKKY